MLIGSSNGLAQLRLLAQSDPKWQQQQLGLLLVRRLREIGEEVQTHGAVRIPLENIKEGREVRTEMSFVFFNVEKCMERTSNLMILYYKKKHGGVVAVDNVSAISAHLSAVMR